MNARVVYVWLGSLCFMDGYICVLGWMMPHCMLRCMLVCVCVRVLILSRLRHKTQWWEANLRVRRSWVLNTFLRTYLNSEPISLIVRSIVLPRENAIYTVPRPLQKLGDDSNTFPCVHRCLTPSPYITRLPNSRIKIFYPSILD